MFSSVKGSHADVAVGNKDAPLAVLKDGQASGDRQVHFNDINLATNRY